MNYQYLKRKDAYGMPNTIDVLGDDITARAIIDGTITEFVDDELNMILNYAFRDCFYLTSVDLPKATSIGK